MAEEYEYQIMSDTDWLFRYRVIVHYTSPDGKRQQIADSFASSMFTAKRMAKTRARRHRKARDHKGAFTL